MAWSSGKMYSKGRISLEGGARSRHRSPRPWKAGDNRVETVRTAGREAKERKGLRKRPKKDLENEVEVGAQRAYRTRNRRRIRNITE